MGSSFSLGFNAPSSPTPVNDVTDARLAVDRLRNVIRGDLSEDLSLLGTVVGDLRSIARDDMFRALNAVEVVANGMSRQIANDAEDSLAAAMEMSAELIANGGDAEAIGRALEGEIAAEPQFNIKICGWWNAATCVCLIKQGEEPPPGDFEALGCATTESELRDLEGLCRNLQAGCVPGDDLPPIPPPGITLPPGNGDEPIPPLPDPDPEVFWHCDELTKECFPTADPSGFATLAECMASCDPDVADKCCPPQQIIVPAPNIDIDIPPCPDPPSEKPPTYSVWQDADNKSCVVVNSNEGPPPGKWRLAQSGLTLTSASAISRQLCPDSPVTESPDLFFEGRFNANEAAVDECSYIEQSIEQTGAQIDNPYAYILGLRDKNGTETIPESLAELSFLGVPFGKAIADGLRAALDVQDATLNGFIDRFFTASPKVRDVTILRVIAGVLSAISSGANRAEVTTLDYERNFLKPYIMPSVDQGIEEFLTDKIDDRVLECILKANGAIPQFFDNLVQARKSKLTAGELTDLWRRGELDGNQFSKRIRELGFLDEGISSELQELSRVLPFVSDITRMMVRDVADQELVERFGMDAEFEQKFTGQLAQWAKQQGIGVDVMRALWRAHWSIPAPGQLFEMWHRLRSKGDTFGNSELGKDINEALIQQDILPFWIPRFEEISFRPLTRRDARRAFEIGAIGEPELERSFRDQGSSDDNAEILTDFTKRLKVGRLERSVPARLYRDGGINRAEAQSQLEDRFGSPDLASQALDRTFDQIQARSRIACTKALQRRFLAGEFTGAQILSALRANGLDEDQAKAIATGWACELDAKGKQFSASQLCTLFDQGLINGDEFFKRLRRVGYKPAEATLIAESCGIKLEKKRVREQATIERKVSQEAKRAASARRQRERRVIAIRKKLVDATVKLAMDLKIETDTASQLVTDALALLRDEFTLGEEEIAEIILRAAKSFKKTPGVTYAEHVRDVAEAWLAESASPVRVNGSQ